MERPVFKPIGTPVEELDTPALVVDADALDANLSEFHASVNVRGVDARPSLSAHLCAEIAHMQVDDSAGFAVSTIAQAEAFASHVDPYWDILIESVVAAPEDAARAAQISREKWIAVAADTPAAVDLLAAAARAQPSGLNMGVVIPIRADSRSVGVAPEDAAAVARRVERESPRLYFAGVFSAPSLTLGNPREDEKAALAALSEAADRCAAYASDGAPRSPYAAARGSALYGETALLNSLAAIGDEKAELIAGSYALGDRRLIERRPEIRPAAHILATVMSEQDPGMVWLDAGQKAVSIDTGLPLVDGIPHATITRMSAEHGCMELSEGARWNVRLGDKIRLIPHDIANAVNVYDYIHVIQDGKLADIWRTVGRGGYG